MSAGNGVAASPPEAVAPTETSVPIAELSDEERARYGINYTHFLDTDEDGSRHPSFVTDTDDLLANILAELRAIREVNEQTRDAFVALVQGMSEAMQQMAGGGMLGMLGGLFGK